MPPQYSTEDCTRAICEATEILGKSPSKNEYRELDLSPTTTTIQNICGSWNEAKEMAGVEKTEQPNIGEPPEIFDIAQDRWENFSRQVRNYYRKKSKWDKEKIKRGCNKCGYNKNPKALAWHHTEPSDKKRSISHLIRDRYSEETIEKEVEKCIVLCANCHEVLNGSVEYSNSFINTEKEK